MEEERFRERLDTLVGSMIYRSALGGVDTKTYGSRFHDVVGHILTAQRLQQVARAASAEFPSSEAVIDVSDAAEKSSMVKARHYSSLVRDLSLFLPATGGSSTHTLGDLVAFWANLTEQDAPDLQSRLEPRLLPLVLKWHEQTGCLGLDDCAVHEHGQEAAEFVVNLVNLLIEETPWADLADAVSSMFQSIADTPAADLDKELQELLGEGCRFLAWKANSELSAALEASPRDKVALSAPEVGALVEYQEQKQGWGSDSGRAIELLGEGLGSELADQAEGRGTSVALHNTLQSAARRSLRQNLIDAVRGKLKSRLVRIALRWLRKEPAKVTIRWEFGGSPLTEKSAEGIRLFLFKRRGDAPFETSH